MQSELFPVQVHHLSTFEREMKKLGKKYRFLIADLRSALEPLEFGKRPGERLQRTRRTYEVYKLKCENSDLRKGKSAGYRLIYACPSVNDVYLLIMWSKSDSPDIKDDALLGLLDALDEYLASQHN